MGAWRRLAWAGTCGVVMMLTVAAACTAAFGQAPAQQGQQTAGQENNSAQQSKTGFAIESEMLTYSAMDGEGATLACNVARNLGAADDKCAPRGGMSNAPGVVVVAGRFERVGRLSALALGYFHHGHSDGAREPILPARKPARTDFLDRVSALGLPGGSGDVCGEGPVYYYIRDHPVGRGHSGSDVDERHRRPPESGGGPGRDS